jgi:hypothetical protein
MSKLTDALERILDFMRQYPTPEYIFLQHFMELLIF